MNEMRRVLALLLCFVMLVGMLPAGALATDVQTTEPSETVVETQVTEATDAAQETTLAAETESIPTESVEESVPATTVVTEPAETTDETTAPTEIVVEDTVVETLGEVDPEEILSSVEALDQALAAVEYSTPAGYTVVDAAVVFTDLHTNKSDYKEDDIKAIMGALAETDLPISSVTSGGDAFSVNEDNNWSNGRYDGYTSKITSAIQAELGNVPVNYVWSDHDRYVYGEDNKLLDKTSHLVYGAGDNGVYGDGDDDNYYVYALSMGDLSSFDRYKAGFSSNRAANGFTDTIENAIAKFQADAAKLKKDRPLLIVSHQPLFDRRNDNAFAELWFDAINEVAETMDVTFFFGHNHKYDESGDYYHAKGSTMAVATKDKWKSYAVGSSSSGVDLSSRTKTLNFTHLCGGYMEPTSTGSYNENGTRRGTVMVVVLLEDANGNEAINLVTYDKDGEYTGSFAKNVTVERAFEHATTEPTDPEPSEPDPSEPDPSEPDPSEPSDPTMGEMTVNGVTVKALGLNALDVETKEIPEAAAGIFGEGAVAYDITVGGFVNYSGTATVTVPVTGENADNFAVFHVDGDKLVRMTGEPSADGKRYTFTTEHFSVFVGGKLAADADLSGTYKEGNGNLSGGIIYTLDVDGVTANKKYLIASGNSDTVHLLTNNGSNNPGDTTAPVNDNQITIEDDSKVAWVFSGQTSGTAKNQNRYISLGSSSFLNTSERNLTITPQNNGAYRIKRGDSNYWVTYSSGWKRVNKKANLYLYEYTESKSGAAVNFKLQNASTMVLGQGTQTLPYEITVDGETVTNATVTWSSSDSTVVSVANGVLTANKKGSATITATLTHVNGKALAKPIALTTQVSVTDKLATALKVPEVIDVFVGTRLTQQKRGDIEVIYSDTDKETVPLTLDMLGGNFDINAVGSYSVTITYAGVTEKLTLNVNPRQSATAGDGNNYPEYPDEGAVKVNKTGTGIDFQSSGIAQIEVSASGVPIKKGADVIIMLDTSSSMTKSENAIKYSDGTSALRSKVLEDSLKNLIALFKADGEDGEPMDLKVAIADFNGYYGHNSNGTSGTPYDRTDGDYVKNGTQNGSGYSQASEAIVYTNCEYRNGTPVVNSGTLDETAFLAAEDLRDAYTLNYTQGTNYDYAFDAIYQLGTAIKAENKKNGEDRDLYVIFMSDGASLQWNYFGTQNTYTKWNNWLAGTWDADDLTTTNLNTTTHSYFYDLDDHDGDGHINEHRMANAIKGNPEDDFEIIRKSAAGLPDGTLTAVSGKDYLYKVKGLGATMFTINFDAKKDGQITVDNIDKALASTASDQTGSTQYYYKIAKAEDLGHAFDVIGAEIAYAATNARFVDQMGNNFNLHMETSEYTVIKYDANGDPVDANNDGNFDTETKKLVPKIEIISYDIYTKAEADKIEEGTANDDVTEAMVGQRKGTFKILETVTFNADGTEAYSDKIEGGTKNILADGSDPNYVKDVIYAQTFLYNKGVLGVAVNGVNIPTGKDSHNLTTGFTNVLPSETFYWKMGTVQSSELAMRYYVYLEGSMEGTKNAGSYATNEFATLYYDNYQGQHCFKDTVSPNMAWKSANVSYAFYLVNEQGQIVVNQTTGATGTFANRIAITTPVVYEEINLNNTDQIRALDVAAMGDNVLPTYYSLYDDVAKYYISIRSNGTGYWEIEKGEGKVASTYVTNFGTSAQYSNTLKNEAVGDDYTHTVVWFAVVWKLEAHPDTVVVDYGLPVDISVLANDMFGENGKLAGIGDKVPTESVTVGNKTEEREVTLTTSLDADVFKEEFEGKFGTAKINAANGKIRYTLNSMEMDTYDKFAYAVHYTGTVNPGFYYDTVTVIPATTIYYEDSFLEFDNLTWQQKEGGQPWEGDWAVDENPTKSIWEQVGETSDRVQDEDRPGKYSLTDANNIYGFDHVNEGMSTYSLGSAMKATVDYDNAAQASFTFTGTGFDVISMTDSTTGVVMVKVYEVNDDGSLGDKVRDNIVDTYYGYNHGLYNVTYTYTDGEWVKTIGSLVETEDATASVAVFPENPNEGDKVTAVEDLWVLDPNNSEHIWQVPVIQVEKLPYGRYKALIQAVYEPGFDHETSETADTYDFYMDAIRIYDPANDGAADGSADTTIEDAYLTDGEGWPSYIELRNELIKAKTLGNEETDTIVEGIVFIDGDAEVRDAQIADYVSYGPNNEVYLAPGQRVAFLLNTPDNIANVHIGVKSADGNAGTYTITNIARADMDGGKVKKGTYYNARTFTIDTTTDMYYDLTGWKGDIIVISNTGDRYNTKGIISLTNIKSTYTSEPVAVETPGVTPSAVSDTTLAVNETSVYVTPEAVRLTLRSLNNEIDETDSEINLPGEPLPEETLPEESIPEETEPEVTEPEETAPEETEPGVTEPSDEMDDIVDVVKAVVDTIKNALEKFFGVWFR